MGKAKHLFGLLNASSIVNPPYIHIPTSFRVYTNNTVSQNSKLRCRTFTSNQFDTPRCPQNHKRYNKYTKSDVTHLKSLLCESSSYIEDIEDVTPFCTDWNRTYRAYSLRSDYNKRKPLGAEIGIPNVILPSTVEEISNILKYCNQRKLPISVQGGRTGLVQGSIPIFDEFVLNLSKLNKILKFDPHTGILECEAGCVLQDISDFLKTVDPAYIAPYDLGAKGSCQIGGNAATNAGGLRFLRYGSLNSNILGLEVVLADGSVLNTMTDMKKDNTGVKLHQLFIGSEGQLGIITKVCIQCAMSPKSVQLCLLKCRSFENVLDSATRAKQSLSDILSALEFFDHDSLINTLRYTPNAKPVFDADPQENLDYNQNKSKAFYLLIETHGQQEESDKQRVMQFVEELLQADSVDDGIWCDNETQKNEVWRIRESCSDALPSQGKTWKYDLSLPLRKMYGVVEATRERLVDIPGTKCIGYGHIGDFNIHLNVLASKPEYIQEVKEIIEPWVYEYTADAGGSISAEHGMGHLKVDKMHMAKSNGYLKHFKSIKNLLDANNILNPYKVHVGLQD